MTSGAMYDDLIRELCSPSHRSIRHIGSNLTQRHSFSGRHFPGQLGVKSALRRSNEFDWSFLGKFEIYKDGWIVNLKLKFISSYGRLKRQSEMQCENGIRIIQPILRQRIAEQNLLSI